LLNEVKLGRANSIDYGISEITATVLRAFRAGVAAVPGGE
jgi:hypothetical protein